MISSENGFAVYNDVEERSKRAMGVHKRANFVRSRLHIWGFDGEMSNAVTMW